MKYRKGKRTLYRLHYFGEWHTSVRDIGTKSRIRFQKLIDSGKLDNATYDCNGLIIKK